VVERSVREGEPTKAQLAFAEDRGAAYTIYSQSLSLLREQFHSTGRFDDANVKLDEITKLLLMRLHELKRAASGQPDRFDDAYLRRRAEKDFGGSSRTAAALRELSQEILSDPLYQNPDGTSIFGAHPVLNIQPTDDEFASHILRTVRDISDHITDGSNHNEEFDILNESFGHFIRDSFHNTKEDAQYMTPPEVVTSMTTMVFEDVANNPIELERVLRCSKTDPFIIADPTCGVGSFLVQSFREALNVLEAAHVSHEVVDKVSRELRLYGIHGQDKVDRMVRLARLNLLLFGNGGAHIDQGNSIRGPSALDELEGCVDVILTNPPFGADYDVDDLLRTSPASRYPILRELRSEGRIPKRLGSELIMIDRCLSLLRPGGRLVIVVPDNVASARGPDAAVRDAVFAHADLLAVVELPNEAFAQAGTRTKACFLYLQKRNEGTQPAKRTIMMAVCKSLGFQVVTRTGTPIKKVVGENELPIVTSAYQDLSAEKEQESDSDFRVVNESPSVVLVEPDGLINGRWTPGFYHAQRLEALQRLDDLADRGFNLRPLATLATLASKSRRTYQETDLRVISVLHVGIDGTIDLGDALENQPKTPGLRCFPGEVLISKINPRIPRVCVVPEVGIDLGCSSEFEILVPKEELDPFLLAGLLRSQPVQDQIRFLTSGTSSSHNRIKDAELADVLIPMPKTGSADLQRLEKLAVKWRESYRHRYEADAELRSAFDQIHELLVPRD